MTKITINSQTLSPIKKLLQLTAIHRHIQPKIAQEKIASSKRVPLCLYGRDYTSTI